MNKITLAGTVDSGLEFSHEKNGKKFFDFELSVSRQSRTKDEIPCIVPEDIANDVEAGKEITVVGEIRNHNYDGNDGKRHSKIYVFVKEVLPYWGKDKNEVELNGFICQDTTYRTTPLDRKISDFLIAVNRANWKSDYIPCIAWGRNAIRASIFNVGDNVELTGRLQSREYTKRYEDGTEEVRTAYEVSASAVKVIEKEEREEETEE